MSELVVNIFIGSAVIQILWAANEFKKFANPILYINIIFFLHNWSYSFTTVYLPSSYWKWRAADHVSYSSQDIVLLLNLLSLWTFFFVFILLTKKKKSNNYENGTAFRNISIFPSLYFILTLILLFYLHSSGSLSLTYGHGQALTSNAAFSPILQLLGLRYVFAAAYFILSREKSTTIIVAILVSELFVSFLEGGRKPLIILIFSLGISYLENRKFGLKMVCKITALIFMVTYLLLLIIFTRDIDPSSSLSYRISEAHRNMAISIPLLIPIIINFANSEGVQNWVFQLVESHHLDLSLGQSYFQAIVNMVILRPFQGMIADWQAAYVFKYAAFPNLHNHGYDFSFTAEAILNWGPSFSFLSYAFLAYYCALLYNKRNNNDFWRLHYISSWAILFIGFRTDSTSVLRMVTFFLFVSMIGFINLKNAKLSYKPMKLRFRN